MPTKKKKWTIIFLVSAKSNLYYEMITAINEIYSVGSNDHINYVIIYDGLEAGKFKPEFSKPSVYYADSGIPFLVAQPEKIYPEFDLTNEDDLSTIISDIKTAFPAEHYGFVYKGHGGRGNVDVTNGSVIEEIVPIPKEILEANDDEKIDKYLKSKNKEGYSGLFVLQRRSDTVLNGSVLVIYKNETRSLSHVNIAHVMRKNFDGAKELAFVFMDCCWAMQIENLYEYKYITKYYIASADEMPALGLGKGYSTFCSKINERPQVRYEEIADLLISIYYTYMYNDYDQEGAPANFSKMGVSLTCADASDLKYFTEKFIEFCKILNDNMDDMHLIIAEARDKCYDFTYEAESEYGVYNIDLIWFLENLLHFNRADLQNEELEISINTLMRICMLYLRKSFMGSNYKDPYPGSRKRICRGITITFPAKKDGLADNKNQIGPERRDEVRFYKKTGWPLLLKNYFETIEKYEHSITGMNEKSKSKIVKSLKDKGFKNISTVTITELNYSEYIKGLQETNLDPKWGKPKNI